MAGPHGPQVLGPGAEPPIINLEPRQGRSG